MEFNTKPHLLTYMYIVPHSEKPGYIEKYDVHVCQWRGVLSMYYVLSMSMIAGLLLTDQAKAASPSGSITKLRMPPTMMCA